MKQVLIAFDQLINAVLGGWADETVSARCHRTKRLKLEKIINWLFNNPTHCYDSYIAEKLRQQSPPEERI